MKRKRATWTPAMDRRLRRLYATLSAQECAEALGVTLGAIHNRVHFLGLSKSPEWRAERTRRRWAEGRHENSRAGLTKGRGWNKGLPQAEWMPAEARRRCAATQFKAGRPPHECRNYRPIGSLRLSKDGYLERKVTDDHPVPARRWVAVHRLVWEQAHGPVPPGHAVVFKPGRRTTVEAEITLDRLECITRAELMRRNSYHTRLPPEVAQLVQLRGALHRKINNRLRKQANEREGRS